MTSTLFLRLAAHDRALLTRWAIGHSASRLVRLFWLTVTHLGGAVCAIALAVLPLLVDGLPEQGRASKRFETNRQQRARALSDVVIVRRQEDTASFAEV